MAAQLKGNKFYLHSTCFYYIRIGSALMFLPLHLRARVLRAPVFVCSKNAKKGAARLCPAHRSFADPSGDIIDMYRRENPAKNTVWEKMHEQLFLQ